MHHVTEINQPDGMLRLWSVDQNIVRIEIVMDDLCPQMWKLGRDFCIKVIKGAPQLGAQGGVLHIRQQRAQMACLFDVPLQKMPPRRMEKAAQPQCHPRVKIPQGAVQAGARRIQS